MLITEPNKIKTYYNALIERKDSFVGIFFVGVKTTSIFCIATCRARKPKLKNVEFYTTFKDALDNGYRPCKICKPTENANETPKQVTQAIELIKFHPKEKITDQALRESNISPEIVRRWFKKNYNVTFHAYQRMYRINHAIKELKDGKKTSEAAYNIGYDSLSGFGYTYKKLLGNSPQHEVNKNPIRIHRFTTPLGPMFVCATEEGVCLLEFVDRRMLETEFTDLQKRLQASIIVGENKHTKQVISEINEYFAGERKTFTVSLHTPGTEFQQKVWASLQAVPYATTSSYQAQASLIKKPKAVRAVANANGQNRVAIIIPCHRIIGKDGTLTGYGGGIERKRWLIDHEKACQ